MTDEKAVERAETKRYAQALLRRGEPTKYIMDATGLSGTTISRYRSELAEGAGRRENDPKKMNGYVPVNFEADWIKYAGIIRKAYRSGRIRKVIKLVPEERSSG